tara:strand:- start:3498 stop:4826 length:1329 start_codon:yes stop_codon:yes gene_type:complete
MKVIERHLYSRKGYYYFRKSFPRNLQCLLPSKEVWIGLNTKDLSVARVQSVQIDFEISQHIQSVQKDLITLLPEQSPDKAIHDFLEKVDSIKDSYGYEQKASYSHLLNGTKHKGEMLFSDLVQEYLKDCMTDKEGTRFHKENTYQLFIELMGDIALRNIGKDTAKGFKSKLMKIPANAKKKHNIKSFAGVDLNKLEGKPQHPKTINNRLAYLIAMFNWAIRADYYHNQNPFSHCVIRGQKVTANRRHPFKQEELKTLFQSGLGKDSMYWVTMIGVYSGMRLNEICQLYISDIRQEAGVYIFDVNDDGDDKGLKTASSRRKVPIHKELISQGFLDYMNEIKAKGHKRLFPDITMGKHKKNYSSTFSKRFSRQLEVTGLKKNGLCFHSLRHTFIDGMRNAGVERSIVMAITGHQSAKGVHDAYGYGYNLPVLQEGINKLKYSIE